MPKAILLDISGVLYEDARPLPGAVEAVRHLCDKGYPLSCRWISAAVRREVLVTRRRG